MTQQLRCKSFERLPHNQEKIECVLYLDREKDKELFHHLIEAHKKCKEADVNLYPNIEIQKEEQQ